MVRELLRELVQAPEQTRAHRRGVADGREGVFVWTPPGPRISAPEIDGDVSGFSTADREVADAGIVVMGHIGLTPQSSGQLGGHKAQGRTVESAQLVIEDALAIEESGAQLLLLEAVPPEVAGFITQKLSIPVLSIGAGLACDGQLLIVSDLIGQFQAFTPKFVKKYANIAEVITDAMKEYFKDVKNASFPADEHCYHMLKGEDEKFKEMIKKYK